MDDYKYLVEVNCLEVVYSGDLWEGIFQHGYGINRISYIVERYRKVFGASIFGK